MGEPPRHDSLTGLEDPHTLVELLNRVLDRGVVVVGHVTISVAGVDLVYLGLNAVLTSVSTARGKSMDRVRAEAEGPNEG
jgi:gas vesicle structural protein